MTDTFRTRDALASDGPAVPEGELTDEELLRTYGQARRDHCYEGPSDDWPKRAERAATIAGLRAVEAAVIARRPVPAPPAEGEVAELVEWMKSQVTVHPVAQTQWAKRFVRIAELLQSFASPAALVIKPSPERLEQLNSQPPGRVELLAGDSQHQQVAPVPVDELMAAYRAGAADAAQALEFELVSEHPWDWEGWCDENGRCWFGAPRDGAADAGWILRKPSERLSHQTVSLPAHALPLPSGEGNND